MATTLQWQLDAIRDLEETDLSYEQIADKYGRSRSTIIKLRERNGIVRKITPKNTGPKSIAERKELSSRHRALGLRLTNIRSKLNYYEMAELLGVSWQVVKLMENGAHDVTLRQLQKISDVTGVSIEELITPFQEVSAGAHGRS